MLQLQYSSTITLTEVLVHPIRSSNKKLAQEYTDILIHSGGFKLMPITASIAAIAADLRARYNLRTPDALHVATAIEARCDSFLTNDVKLNRITEIKVQTLDDLDLSK